MADSTLAASKIAFTPPQAEIISLHKLESDQDLVVALREGRIGAPAVLVDRYGGLVQGLLLRVLGFESEVPDLLNEVFVRALERIDELKQPSSLKSWLGSIAVFTARAWLRKRRFRRKWLSFLPSDELPEVIAPTLDAETSEVLKRTYRTLNLLPPDERIAFTLRFVEGTSLGEAAALTGVSLATIKRRISRAQARFLEAAKRDPILQERILQGGRWSTQ